MDSEITFEEKMLKKLIESNYVNHRIMSAAVDDFRLQSSKNLMYKTLKVSFTDNGLEFLTNVKVCLLLKSNKDILNARKQKVDS